MYALALFAALGVSAAPAGARVFASQSEALAQAFPQAERIERQSTLLAEGDVRALSARAQSEFPSRLVTLHTARQGERVLGHAVIDVHTVRTFPEALLVVLDARGRVTGTRILAFYEPRDYLPSARWLAQFVRRTHAPALRLGGEIHGIAGATLSARAVTQSVRRSIALFEWFAAREAGGA